MQEPGARIHLGLFQDETSAKPLHTLENSAIPTNPTDPMKRLELAYLPGPSGLSRGAHKFAQRGDVGPVSSDACSIHREPEPFGSFYIDSGVIEFGEAKPNGWKHALGSTRVDRAWRTVPLPGPVCDCEELVPIVLVPYRSLPRLRDLGRSRHEMRQLPLWSLPGARLNSRLNK